jgi:predicted permease
MSVCASPTPPGSRIADLLLRLYPRRTRARFGAGMRYALLQEAAAARARGRLAIAVFWTCALGEALCASLLARLSWALRPRHPGSGRPFAFLRIDARDAWRALSRSPLVTSLAVLSLALGIGANTAVFSIVNGLYLRSLPVPEPGQLAVLGVTDRHRAFSHPAWAEIRDVGRLDAFAWYPTRFDLSPGGETDFVDGAWASARIFDVLRLPPAIGRGFTADDDRPGGGPDGPVAVISDRLWQQRFGGRPDAIGQTLLIQRRPFTVAGVMPPGFHGPDAGRACDIILPLGSEPLVRGADSWLNLRTTTWLRVMARVAPPETFEAASARVRAVQAALRDATMPASRAQNDLAAPLVFLPAAGGVATSVGRDYRLPLQILMAIVALVLLVACANVAALQLVRASARRRDLSIRLALGASRWRVARQCLAESALVAGAGAFAGLLVAQWTSRLLVSQIAAGNDPLFLDLEPDARVLAFTGLVATMTALVFGTAPAVRAAGTDPGETMALSSRGIAGARRGFAGDALIVLQVALSLVLIVFAGVFVRTFSSLATIDLGFDRGGVLLARVTAQRRTPIEARPDLYLRLQRSVAAAPGVAAAGISVASPISGSTWGVSFNPEGKAASPETDANVYAHHVTPGWFAAYGVPLTQGRDFADTDRAGSPRVAIVNQALARTILRTGSPVGRLLVQTGLRTPPAPLLVIGVVGDAAYLSAREPAPPTMFLPLLQMPSPPPAVTIAARGGGANPAALAKTVAAAVASVDPELPLTFRTLEDQVNASLIQERLLAMVSAFFGVIALLLAGLGLYGLMAHGVALRRSEIGVRMALGAAAPKVIRLVLGRAALLVAAGVLIGAALSRWTAGFGASLAFGLEPGDVATLAASVLLLVVVGLVAAWAPARRAMRVDPAEIFRQG